MVFHQLETDWHIEVNTAFLPRFEIAPLYVETLQENALENSEYAYLRQKLAKGKWLKRIVHRRNQTLCNIGKYILKNQLAFFNGEKRGLAPMTMTEVASALNLHESTIARAVAHKYLACPLGIFPLKVFFSQGLQTQTGEKISQNSIRDILAHTIENEDKNKPMSDAKLAEHFKKLGIPCARRTIAKYRALLNIAPASLRKKWTNT